MDLSVAKLYRQHSAPSMGLLLAILAIVALETAAALALLLPFVEPARSAAWFERALLVVMAMLAALAPFLVLAVLEHRRRNRLLREALHLSLDNEQLRRINRISVLLARESRPRGVARALAEGVVQELGAARAVFWAPGAQGEPDTPLVALPESDQPQAVEPLGEPGRHVLARRAASEGRPLVLRPGQAQPQPLDPSRPWEGPFAAYFPVQESGTSLGVLEAQGEGWGPYRWRVLEAVLPQAATALERARHFEEMRELAHTDYVTGLFNYRFIQSYLHRLIPLMAARRRPLAVILVDVDNFKGLNDTYGHSTGDRVLQAIAGQLRLMTDRVGLVGRYGGDEFIVVLPGHSRPQAEAFVEALRDWLANLHSPWFSGHALPLRLSCGIAVFPEDGRKRQQLLAVADARLYQAKCAATGRPQREKGRNGARRSAAAGVFGLLDNLVASIDSRDHYTRAHCEATAEYAILLAQELGLSPTAQRTLRLAALLHDVGKIGIPDHILRKPGRLSPEEFAVIKHHTAIAEHLIVDIPNAEEVRLLARHHHERFDGSGYPDGLKGEEIPFLARVLSVADTFSAITLDRPYCQGLPLPEAYQELRRAAGSQLDPALVEAFGRVVCRLVSERAPAAGR